MKFLVTFGPRRGLLVEIRLAANFVESVSIDWTDSIPDVVDSRVDGSIPHWMSTLCQIVDYKLNQRDMPIQQLALREMIAQKACELLSRQYQEAEPISRCVG